MASKDDGIMGMGRLNRRNVLLGTVALAASPLLGGIARAQDKIDMRINWWGSDARHQKTLKLIKLFEQKNPGIKMTPEYGGLIGYQDKLSTEFAGGHAPDVMQLDDGPAALAGAGRLLPLDDYIASGKLDLANANKNVLETSKINGKLYSIPWGLACGCYFLDTKVFADSKVELPQPDWNWDAYAKTARALSKDGFYGSADIWAPAGTRSLAPFEFFLRQNGKFAFTPEGKIGFGKDELTEWFTFWDDLRKAGAVPPADVTALESGFETSPLITGKAAMYPINSSIASSLQGLTQHKLVVTTIPSGIGSKALPGPKVGAFINASMQIYVNAASQHKDKAIAFLNFITNDPDEAKIHLMARGVPLSSKMADLVSPEISPVEQSMVEMIKWVQANAQPVFVPWPKTSAQIQDLMQRSHQAIAFEQASIADTVSQFIDEAGQATG